MSVTALQHERDVPSTVPGARRVRSQRRSNALEPAPALHDHVEPHCELRVLRVSCKPRLRGTSDAAGLDLTDHLQRVAEALAAFRLDLAEDERPAAPGNHVELSAR